MKGDYRCEICNLRFDELDAFDDHVKEYHPEVISPEELLPKICVRLIWGDYGFEFSKN